MILSLEPTNVCNLKCWHCMRDKLEERRSIPLGILQRVLPEAKACGFSYVSVTGGEPALYPQLDELLNLIAREDLQFQIITNGYRFRSEVLPILTTPHVRRHLHHIAISLDGATARTHDASRGEGAFKAAMDMVALCKLKDIPFNFITVVNNFNKTELVDISLLGSGLGAMYHLFGPHHVTPLAVRNGIVPSPKETNESMTFVARTLTKALKMPIAIGPGARCQAVPLQCHVARGEQLHVDFQGNAIFCCTLSHLADDDRPDDLGEELLADLRWEPLGAAIVRQKLLVARLVEERLRAAETGLLTELDYLHCYWCFKRFGKLKWLANYSDSPWAEGPSNALYAFEA